MTRVGGDLLLPPPSPRLPPRIELPSTSYSCRPDRRRGAVSPPRPLLRRLPRTRKMSCQKLSRKCLHLVSHHGRGRYSLSRMGVSSLFYPSTAAAEAKAKTKQVINKLGVVGSIGRLPEPEISFRPYQLVVPKTYCLINVFALFGESKNKIICSDEFGNSSIYNTELNSFSFMAHSPKGHKTMVVSMPCTAANAASDFVSTDSLYMLDMSTYCFEVLSYNPVGGWSCRPLPLPPFFSDPEYKAPIHSPSFVVDGTRICVSTSNATYAFDTVACEWSKVGDWVLPFKAEYVSELGLWIGLSDHKPYDLCALEGMSSTAMDSPPPMVQRMGREFEPLESWSLLMRTLVHVGSRRLCIANLFEIITNEAKYDTVEVAVFTGVEVLPDESGLRMIKHKTKCFIAGTMYVF